MEKVIVNYDEVMRAFEFKAKVNSPDLKTIEWVRDDGSAITFDDRLVEDWKFTGLSNCYFAKDYLTLVLDGKEETLLKGIEDVG